MKRLLLGLFTFPLLAMPPIASADQVDPHVVLNEARRLAKDGNYEEALQKHIWFHENALDTAPSLAGVRLSFALHDWTRLAERYPPAGEALRSIRDKQEAELEQGSGTYHDFLDVKGINEYLGHSERTIRLFKRIDQQDPEFARQVYRVVSDELVAAGEHNLARTYMGTPEIALADLRERFQQNLQIAKENPQLDNDHYHAYRETSFRRGVAAVVEILVATGAEDEARRVFDKAQEVTAQEDELRQAIREAVERGRKASGM